MALPLAKPVPPPRWNTGIPARAAPTYRRPWLWAMIGAIVGLFGAFVPSLRAYWDSYGVGRMRYGYPWGFLVDFPDVGISRHRSTYRVGLHGVLRGRGVVHCGAANGREKEVMGGYGYLALSHSWRDLHPQLMPIRFSTRLYFSPPTFAANRLMVSPTPLSLASLNLATNRIVSGHSEGGSGVMGARSFFGFGVAVGIGFSGDTRERQALQTPKDGILWTPAAHIPPRLEYPRLSNAGNSDGS